MRQNTNKSALINAFYKNGYCVIKSKKVFQIQLMKAVFDCEK